MFCIPSQSLKLQLLQYFYFVCSFSPQNIRPSVIYAQYLSVHFQLVQFLIIKWEETWKAENVCRFNFTSSSFFPFLQNIKNNNNKNFFIRNVEKRILFAFSLYFLCPFYMHLCILCCNIFVCYNLLKRFVRKYWWKVSWVLVLWNFYVTNNPSALSALNMQANNFQSEKDEEQNIKVGNGCTFLNAVWMIALHSTPLLAVRLKPCLNWLPSKQYFNSISSGSKSISPNLIYRKNIQLKHNWKGEQK